MKKTIFLFLFLFPLYVSFSQNIKGSIVNDTGHRLSNVNIYLDGTKTGTVSGEDGSFMIELPAHSGGNLVFQKEQYETYSISSSQILNRTLKVVLNKTNEIEEIEIIPYTEEAYKNFITYFLDNFIGYDRENVKIKNQRSLKFAYDKKNNTLKVKAPKTLLIENKNLGYEIEYNLISFSADFGSQMVNYTGTSFFRETKESQKVKLNRLNAYDGSLLHFFRSIYKNTIPDDRFIVNHIVKIPNPQYPTDEELKTLKNFLEMAKVTSILNAPEDILDISRRKNTHKPYALAVTKTLIPDSDYVKRPGGKVLFSFKDMLQVNYQKYFYELKGKEFIKTEKPVLLSSFLHPEGEIFEISKDGNITTPDLLITEGDFSKNKIENMLPLDYQPGD